jgi:hypothetical protein
MFPSGACRSSLSNALCPRFQIPVNFNNLNLNKQPLKMKALFGVSVTLPAKLSARIYPLAGLRKQPILVVFFA